MRSVLLRVFLLGIFTIAAIVLFLPSTPIANILPEIWVKNFPKIVLGLDLQGGMHLVLDVDQDKAIQNHMQRVIGAVTDSLRKKQVSFISIAADGTSGMVISFPDEKTREAISKVIEEDYPVFSPASIKDGKAVYTLSDKETSRLKESALSQALETIRNRIDKFGVTEPVIQKQGDREIVVELPGLKDPERAIQLIGKTAVLEFRLLDESEDVSKALKYGPPPDDDILYETKRNPDGTTEKIPFLVKKEVLLTGDFLSDARVAIDQFNEPYVSLTFDSNGARIFGRITSDNTGKRLAIVLDGNVHSAPVIREAITGGKAQISGGFTYDEATDLAIVLRAGALPAPVHIIQNVTVGPSVGQDSIRSGVRAGVLGGFLVLLFMFIYYRVSGLVADFAMVLNVIMLLGAMAWLNSTLTLPGIAGIVLTMGMGVDSNVLIFERIKEELKTGRTPRSAVNAGYDRAWWTIVDSHVTMLITAAVLFQFGSGPIKGFAVSLSLGILINLFTSLVGTKLIFDIQNDKFRVKRLSI